MATDAPRGVPISIWKYAYRLIGSPTTITMSNTHCVHDNIESTERCFGVWAPAGQLLHLIHTATVATMEDPRYKYCGPALADMLMAASGHTVGAGMLFTFPGWVAVDAIGRPWKGI